MTELGGDSVTEAGDSGSHPQILDQDTKQWIEEKFVKVGCSLLIPLESN